MPLARNFSSTLCNKHSHRKVKNVLMNYSWEHCYLSRVETNIMCAFFRSSHAVPSATPSSFTISQISARDGTFSWDPLPILDRNGMIVSYSLACDSTRGSVTQLFSIAGSFPVTGFWPDTVYRCNLWASNSAGRGPAVERSITTLDDGIYIWSGIGLEA